MGILPPFISVHHMHSVLEEAEEGVRNPGTAVNSLNCLMGARKSNPDLLEGQPVLLTD